MLKYLIISLLLLCTCAYIYRNYEDYSVVQVDDVKYIENWRKNGIKIISIDTIHTAVGNQYKVKCK